MVSLQVSARMQKSLILLLVLSLLASLPSPGSARTGAMCANQAGACCRNCPLLREAKYGQRFCTEACGRALPKPALPMSSQAPNSAASIVITVISPTLTALTPSFARYNASPPMRTARQLDILCSRQL
jgi:hypothetical protein